MNREDVNRLMLDHMNGKLTLAEALRVAFSRGYDVGYEEFKVLLANPPMDEP